MQKIKVNDNIKKIEQEFFNKTITSFKFFNNHIFSDSFKDNAMQFVGGEYVDEVCDFFQDNQWNMAMAPRKYFKSTGLYSKLMWNLWKLKEKENQEWSYFSFSQSLAGEHINNIKKLIKNNRYFEEAGIIDMKTTAETVIKYTWNNKNIFRIIPSGALTFKRGLHRHVICDDILKDPTEELDPLIIKKINKAFKEEIFFIPMHWQEFIIRGTPQTKEDFFFDKKIQKKIKLKEYKAIIDEPKKIALWPEWESFEFLIDERDIIGKNVFNKEKMCAPVKSVNSYIDEDKLYAVVNKDLKNYDFHGKFSKTNKMYAGWDLGKIKHPSFYSVFEAIPINKEYKIGEGKIMIKNKYIQRFVKWWDGIDYSDQLDDIRFFNKMLGVNKLWFDNTKDTLTTYIENKTLGREFVPVNFTRNKHQRPTDLRIIVNTMNIELIDDARQLEVMLAVDSELRIMETTFEDETKGKVLNHGDSFIGNMLAVSGGESVKEFGVVVL